MPEEHPDVSIVIPVFNEETIIRAAVADLRSRLSHVAWSREILLAENGSSDSTLDIARELAETHADVRFLSTSRPNYGKALKEGIGQARGKLVICEEIDLCDTRFHETAIRLLNEGAAEFVIGSKLLPGAKDKRPWLRHAASQGYSAVLRGLLGFPGSDTHGLKAFRSDVVRPLVAQCVVEKDVFASELVIRAYRGGVRVKEIPVEVMERRPPSINLLRRVPSVVSNLTRLFWALKRPST